MSNIILDKFADLLDAVKEDDTLKNQLIQICELPKQQRIVEIEKFQVEHKDIPISKLFHLFKNEIIVKEIVKYLKGEYEEPNLLVKLLDFIKTKFIFIIIIFLLIIIIYLLIFIIKGKDTQKKVKLESGDTVNLDEIILPKNYKKSIYIEYNKIINEDNPEIKYSAIKQFLKEFPTTDYSEEIKVIYLKTLFELNKKTEIDDFLKYNMDYSSKYFFDKINILIQNNYTDKAKQLISMQLNKSFSDKTKYKLRKLLGDIFFYENKFQLAIDEYFYLLKKQNLSNELTSEIALQLTNIFRIEKNYEKLEQVLNDLINTTENAKYKVLGIMMLCELNYLNDNKEKTKQLCNRILELPEQQITYIFYQKKLYTSYAFAKFILNRLNI